MAEDLTIDMKGCARCHGPGHDGIVFKPLDYPVPVWVGERLIHVNATHWAPCPTNGQPILLTRIKKEDSMSEIDQEAGGTQPPQDPPAPQEREHMEDSRPEEPGTVGDTLDDDQSEADPAASEQPAAPAAVGESATSEPGGDEPAPEE